MLIHMLFTIKLQNVQVGQQRSNKGLKIDLKGINKRRRVIYKSSVYFTAEMLIFAYLPDNAAAASELKVRSTEEVDTRCLFRE